MSLKEKILEEIDECTWDLLDKNIKRDAVFILKDEKIELVDAAVAIAEDNASLIQGWLSEELLVKVTMEDSPTYKNSTFLYAIVSPFVVIKEMVGK